MSLAALAGGPPRAVVRTRYRPPRWSARDSLVVVAALLSGAIIAASIAVDPSGLRYEPYPRLEAPAISVPAILAGLLLLAPAAVAPLPLVEERP
jgi:hypothetical protein